MSWKDRRISAINRISKRKRWKTDDSNPYFEEYDLVLHTSAKTKKEYKKLMLPKGRQHQ